MTTIVLLSLGILAFLLGTGGRPRSDGRRRLRRARVQAISRR
jgi:hypothetical protein